MDARDKLIAAIAKRECDRIARSTIRALQRMAEGMQSGDSRLINLWDEICVQVQRSVFWKDYEDVVYVLIHGAVKQLPVELVRAIWLQTNAADAWEDDEEPTEIPVCDSDIVEHILGEVLGTAADWSNSRIRSYNEGQCEFD